MSHTPSGDAPTHTFSFRLALEQLDDRITPTLNLLLDYSLDSYGFFEDPIRRATLERAAADLTSRLESNFAAITPSGGNTWSFLFNSPATGEQVEVRNPSVPANTIIVYAGGRPLDAAEAGVGGFGGYRAAGDSQWLNLVATRGVSGFSLWGGSIAFDLDQNWSFDTGAPAPGTIDFYTVATHELGHVLGFGTAQEFFAAQSPDGRFRGPATTALAGELRLSADRAHWANGTTWNGQPTSMQPYVQLGQRYGFSELDYAGLQDIGWTVRPSSAPAAPPAPPIVLPNNPTPTVPSGGGIASPAPLSPPVPRPSDPVMPSPISPPPVSPPLTTPSVNSFPPLTRDLVAVSGSDGTVKLVRLEGDGRSTLVTSLRPFPNFFGTVRSTLADVNGDGTPDLVAVVGPGGGSLIRVIDGQTGTTIGNSFSAFEPTFTGGLLLAAADVDGDGRDEVIVSADQGGGGRVTLFRFDTATPRVMANFFGIEDLNFRGGARVAAADVNNDGVPDVVVAAGYGGGPRVAIFDGTELAVGRTRRLVNDFFAFTGGDIDGLRNGLYLSAGDLNGDGRADLVFGGGPGGAPRVMVVSGAAVAANPVQAVAAPLANFFAFDLNQRGGARVTVRNSELIVASGPGGPLALRAYTAGNFSTGTTYPSFGITASTDGVYVG